MSKKIDNPNAFKNFINSNTLQKYYDGVKNIKSTASPATLAKLKKQLLELELKQRVHLIRDFLYQNLDSDYKKSVKQLLSLIKDQELRGFELWPATEFIQKHGLENIQVSLDALYTITPLFTSEFGIRPFINKYNDEIYTHLMSWVKDPNPHVRRWLSEGTRPRLPWGEKLNSAIKNPTLGLKILEELKFDSELYVRKSVSNHLNDIAKDHPELVVATIKRWQKSVPSSYKKEFEFIKKQALRTLIKDGHPSALKVMGVTLNTHHFKVKSIKILQKEVRMNSPLSFELNIQNTSNQAQKFIIDYKIHHQKANGQLTAKVFKLRTGVLKANELLILKKNHMFKPITTRKYYSGIHHFELILNGTSVKKSSFHLKV